MLTFQRDACIKALKVELSTMRPHVTIVMTGGTFNLETLHAAFGPPEDWHPNTDRNDLVSVTWHSEWGPVLWIDHPRILHKAWTEVLSFVAGFVSAVVTERMRVRGTSSR